MSCRHRGEVETPGGTRARTAHRSRAARAAAPAWPARRGRRRARVRSRAGAAAALGCALAALLALSAPAQGSDPFPLEESFRGTQFGSQWRHGGSAVLTAGQEAEGWLRLTSAQGNEFGYAYDDDPFPSSAGVLVEFEYADWGGSGADGLTFFMFDGATSESEFHAGQPGGSLGYAPCNGSPGLSNAYVGVGFDEYGNFTNLGSICGLDGWEIAPNRVSVRGSAAEDYKLLATAPTSESLRAERSQARKVTIAVSPSGELSVYIRFPDGTYQKVTEAFQLPAAPAQLKFGYVASTGGLDDNHEIRDAEVIEPTQLTPSVAQTGGGHERGEQLTWTAVVRNEGPNATEREQIQATTGEQALSGVSWTCSASGGAECGTTSGSGLPDLEAGAMPEGSSLSYTITGTPTATTDFAQMTVTSEPRGDTGERDPEHERATATTDLTPLFATGPSFTLAAGGEARAALVPALGGDVVYHETWQRCEADGSSCADIAGAEATTYQTTGADLGHTIRFAETATNGAGSTTVASAAYEPLPAAEITSAPAPYTASREAVLAFDGTPGATLECSLDEGAWHTCASPVSYAGLADGEHTFSVRALYGGLSAPLPATARWTVEGEPPPRPTIVSAPVTPSASAEASFTFGGIVEGAGLECRLDEGEWFACGAVTELGGLSDGFHSLQARQVNRAGVASEVVYYTWTVEMPAAPMVAGEGQEVVAAAGAPPGAGASPGARAQTAARTKDAKAGSKCGKARSKGAKGGSTCARPAPRCAKPGAPGARRESKGVKPEKRCAKPRTVDVKPPARGVKPPARGVKPAPNGVKPAPNGVKPAPNGVKPAPNGAEPPAKGVNPPAKGAKPAPNGAKQPAKGVKPAPKGAKPRHPVTSPPRRSATRPSSGPGGPAAGRGTAPRSAAPRERPGAPHPREQPAPQSAAGGEHPASSRAGKRAPRASGPGSAVRSAPGGTRSSPTAHPRRGGSPSPVRRTAPSGRTERTGSPASSTEPGTAPRSGAAPPLAAGRVPGAIVIWPFAAGSVAVVHAALEEVEQAAKEIAHARAIVCVGYTDALGTPGSNLAIGLKRARNVCAELRRLGIRAVLRSVSRGQEDPRASNATAQGRALNRRVELRMSF